MEKRMYVLTGGPGVGKTTLIEILSAKGYYVVPEAARIVSEEEQAKGSNIVPWKDVRAFQELVVHEQLKNEEAIPKGEAFLDRSIVDGVAYSRFYDVPPPPEIEELARNRYTKVFLLESLPQYLNDATRRETEDFRAKIYPLLLAAYKEFGYEPILVPVLPPTERADFILNHIQE